MSTTTAGTAREGMTMSDETTRLRALLERATQTPWEVTEIRDGRQPEGVEELGVFAPCDVRSYQKPDETWHGALICRGMDGPTRAANAALIVAAVNALPGLLDAAERAARAERERDDLAAVLETRNAEHALAMERVRELLAACEAFSGPDCGTVFDGRDCLCGGCGNYRGDDMDPAEHDAGCTRLAARQLAARIRAEVSRG